MIDVQRSSILFAVLISTAFTACGTKKAAEKVADACNGLTLEELKQQNDITPECRSAVQDLLQGISDNFNGRVLTLGMDKSDASTTIYTSGLSKAGKALTAEDFAKAMVTSVTTDGTETAVDAAKVTATAFDPAADLVSISFVNDYSASMRDEDVATVADILTKLVDCMPAKVEGQVIQFSSGVDIRQAYTNDTTALKAAFALDKNYTRQSTALYDGMGQGMTDLAARPRVAKILVVSTDGLENSSTKYAKDTITKAVKSAHIAPLMLGSLFSDADALEDLATSNGAFIYAKSLTAISDSSSKICQALKGIKLTVNGDYRSAKALNVKVSDATGTYILGD